MNDNSQITLFGTLWCGGSRRARLLFEQHKIPYRWVDIEMDEEAAKYLEKINGGYRSVPTVIWPDGSKLVEPSIEDLAKKIGIKLSS